MRGWPKLTGNADQKNPESDVAAQTRSRKRGRVPGGILFPRNSLREALKIAETIWKSNAGEPFDPILLAQALNTTHRSSGFTTLASASERYGLTTGSVHAKTISLTEMGKTIVAPTDEAIVGPSLRKALLTPSVFNQFYSKYDRKNIPREDIVKTVLESEFGVPRVDVEACYAVLMKNVKDYGLSMQSGEGVLLYLDNLSKGIAPEPGEGPVTEEEKEPQPLVTPLPTVSRPRVFISHSKNMKILNQVEQMLKFGEFEYDVAVERETTAIPIPDKIFGMMRGCTCAVINVSADEQEKKEDGTYSINQNVLIEIGAAFLLYNKRIILLVDKRVQLPSNLQGLAVSYYEGMNSHGRQA